MTGHSIQPWHGSPEYTKYSYEHSLRLLVYIPRNSIRHEQDEYECRYRAMQQRRTKDDGHQSLSLSRRYVGSNLSDACSPQSLAGGLRGLGEASCGLLVPARTVTPLPDTALHVDGPEDGVSNGFPI
ncbi:hypothetical protein CFAM422_007951 [Trichoderma lentiforme]|uniref:Uncharacterized protein n=1 Tax=Trichoderma lentiforme TaxID=1567552 RepID=A0A9P5CD26_9HYPO|nr:hypothetical protein CFAM422_007951 [Trichoderma lentiforme]